MLTFDVDPLRDAYRDALYRLDDTTNHFNELHVLFCIVCICMILSAVMHLQQGDTILNQYFQDAFYLAFGIAGLIGSLWTPLSVTAKGKEFLQSIGHLMHLNGLPAELRHMHDDVQQMYRSDPFAFTIFSVPVNAASCIVFIMLSTILLSLVWLLSIRG